jgi:hypothetical protein
VVIEITILGLVGDAKARSPSTAVASQSSENCKCASRERFHGDC